MTHPYNHLREKHPGQKRAHEMHKHFKRGGAAKHDDEAADKKLFGKLYAAAEKKEPKGMKSGGKWIQKAVKHPGALTEAAIPPRG